MESNKDLESITCMHRFFGDCPKCTRDYTNQINNTHCPNYCEIYLGGYIVKEEIDRNLYKP